MSIRSAASCGQPFAEIEEPRGARIERGGAGGFTSAIGAQDIRRSSMATCVGWVEFRNGRSLAKEERG
jgi:hypothetical protein